MKACKLAFHVSPMRIKVIVERLATYAATYRMSECLTGKANDPSV
jgi:hypothetical protein